MFCKSPDVDMKLIIDKATYECPNCRSVGSSPLVASIVLSLPLYIECSTCHCQMMVTSILNNVTIHYSTPY